MQSTLPNHTGILTHTYDSADRRLTAKHSNFSHIIHKNQGFDNVGNIKEDQFQDKERRFAYDDLCQLISEQGFEEHTFSYDSLHNRILKNGNSCTFNQLNHLLDQEETVYIYDLNGNRIRKEEHGRIITYSYDALNRMIEVKTPEKIIQYTYDPFDRRLLKKIGNVEEQYLYDDNNEIGMVQNGILKQFRILDPSYSSEQGAAIYLHLENKPYIPIHDLYGNTAVLLNENGLPTKTYQYTAFGEVNAACENNPWRYASKRLDPETGLIYFGHRYYDPQIARWISPDPAEYADGPNLYAYLHNNPLNRFDRHGLWMEDLWEGFSSFSQGFGGAFYDFGVGTFGSMATAGAWLNADFEYEYCNDASYFHEKQKSSYQGWQDLGYCLQNNCFETAFSMVAPNCVAAYNMPSTANFSEKWQTLGAAAFDIALLAAPAKMARSSAFKSMGGTSILDSSAASIASKTAQGVESSFARGVGSLTSGAENVNAGVNLSSKLSQLQKFQESNGYARVLQDGRIRYYGKQTLASNPGATKGGCRVLEFNPKTGTTRSWYECYDHFGNVNRVHPKQINGQDLISPHYPPTGRELGY